jgi:hypothetical protein
MGACRRRRLIRNVELPTGEAGRAKLSAIFVKVKRFSEIFRFRRNGKTSAAIETRSDVGTPILRTPPVLAR